MSSAVVQQPASTCGRLSRSEFIKNIDDNLKEIYDSMNELRARSQDTTLPEADLEKAFDNLYDAADLLHFYAKNLNVQPDTDTYLVGEWKWVRDYMSDLVEYGVGNTAEIRRVTNYNLKSKNGTPVGQGDEIEVRHVQPDRRHRGVTLRNWMEVDKVFWLRDHDKELSDYERGETPRYRDYDDYGYDY